MLFLSKAISCSAATRALGVEYRTAAVASEGFKGQRRHLNAEHGDELALT